MYLIVFAFQLSAPLFRRLHSVTTVRAPTQIRIQARWVQLPPARRQVLQARPQLDLTIGYWTGQRMS